MSLTAGDPAPEPFLYNQDGVLLCPHCSEQYVHIDDVYVAGRPREDGNIVPVHVDSAGRQNNGSGVALPIPDVGRRHAFCLRGWCETCAGTFTIEFVQHKGQTLISVREPQWTQLTPKAP